MVKSQNPTTPAGKGVRPAFAPSPETSTPGSQIWTPHQQTRQERIKRLMKGSPFLRTTIAKRINQDNAHEQGFVPVQAHSEQVTAHLSHLVEALQHATSPQQVLPSMGVAGRPTQAQVALREARRRQNEARQSFIMEMLQSISQQRDRDQPRMSETIQLMQRMLSDQHQRQQFRRQVRTRRGGRQFRDHDDFQQFLFTL